MEPNKRKRARKRGPKTAQGKARASRNATKHGVFAQTPVLPLVEDEEEWLRLRQDVLDWFGLEGEFEEWWGERVAMLMWRLKRAARMETEGTRHYQEDVPDDWANSMQMEGLPIPDEETKEQVEEMRRMLMARLLPGEEMMEKVLRYETKLHRHLMQTLYMVMVLKGLVGMGTGRLYRVAGVKPPDVPRPKGTRRLPQPPLPAHPEVSKPALSEAEGE